MADSVLYSVNDVIEALDALHGETVRVAGVLSVEFEGDSLRHAPKTERKPEYESSLWADFDYDALGLSRGQLQEFDGRHVVVTGVVDRECTGHLGLWPGALLIREITKVKIGDA